MALFAPVTPRYSRVRGRRAAAGETQALARARPIRVAREAGNLLYRYDGWKRGRPFLREGSAAHPTERPAVRRVDHGGHSREHGRPLAKPKLAIENVGSSGGGASQGRGKGTLGERRVMTQGAARSEERREGE